MRRWPRAPTRTCPPHPAPWAGSSGMSTGPTKPAPTSTTSCTPSTCGCTTTSGAARTRSCTGCGPSVIARWKAAPGDPGPAGDPGGAGDGVRAARRTGPQRPGRLDVGQRVGAVRGPDGDQAERRLLRRPDPGVDGGLRPGRQAGLGGLAQPVERYRHASVHLPAHARGRRRGAHPLHLRDRLGGAGGGHPVRDHRDGRRVRRRDPGRPVRADRQRRDRPGGGRHLGRAPLPRRADAQPRRVHHRRHRAGRGQGRRDVRGRGADRAPGPRLRRAGPAARGPGGRLVRPLPEPLRPALRTPIEGVIVMSAEAPWTRRKPRIGILGIMQDLYDDMVPGIAQRQEGYAAELAAHLSDVAEFIPSKAIKYREDAERAMREFEDADLDGVLVVMLTYGPAMRVARLLSESRLPLCLANIQPEPSVTPAWDMADMTYNQGVHGAQDTANAMVRAGKRFA